MRRRPPSAVRRPPSGAGVVGVARRLARISPPPWGRLVLAATLGVGGAAASIGLLAGSGYVVGRAAFRPGLGAIAGLLAVVEVMAFLRAPLRYGERLAAHDSAFRALTGWRVWLYDRLEPLSPAGLRHFHSGDLLARAIEDVDVLQDLYLRSLVPIAVAAASSVLAVVVVGVLLPEAAIVLGAALLVALGVPPLLVVRAGAARRHEATRRGELTAEVVDLVQGAPDLLAFGGEAAVLERTDALDAELTDMARRRAGAGGTAAAVATACMGAAVVGVLAVAVAAVHAGRLDPVLAAVLPLTAIAAFETVPAVVAAAARARDVAWAGRRLLDLGTVPAPVRDPASPEPAPSGCPSVQLDRARLRYGDDRPWALDGLSLELAPGQRLAVVGPSGAGKSSIANVLLRFWPLEEGRALVDGVPLDRLAQRDVRRTIGWVEQDARLFAGTVRHNVTLGRPGATEHEIVDALRRVQLDDWIATLPDGLDTAVGEHGARVSGGQRQRIALARALVAGPEVLVLDEPTAGLDAPTAGALLADVLTASGGRSILLITHREQDTEGVETLVMEGGTVVEHHPATAR